MNKRAFLSSFLRSPREVGSVIPSSRFMVKKVLQCVTDGNPSTLVELGGGTGVVTKSLREVGPPLIVFEKDPQLREMLEKQFPDVPVYPDAFELEQVMQEREWEELDAVVCGLPLTLFPKELREDLLLQIYEYLKPGGRLVLYQYSRYMKSTLERVFDRVDSHFTPLNIPPAFVYCCSKKA